MKTIVKIAYRNEPNSLKITSEDKVFDTSRIKNMQVQEWAFPFCIKGVKWKGLYEELKQFTGKSDFVIYFDGQDDAFEIIKYSLEDVPVKLISTNNNVVILYSENPFTTKITVNGKVMDTTRIQNRSIDEWIKPIQIRDLSWKGIFKELEDFIGIDVYSIQFVGKQELMTPLINECPKNVDITFRSPNLASKNNSPKITNPMKNNNNAVNLMSDIASKVNVQNLPSSGQVLDKFKQQVSDEEINNNLQSIPIKNEFIRKNAMAICALISLVLTFLPFFGFSAGAEGYEEKVTVTGITALFGENRAIISLTLFIGPILIIIMNYINALKPYRRIIALLVPLLCIIFEIFTAVALRSICMNYMGIADSTAGAFGGSVDYDTSLLIGFWFILLSYILTAIIGFITYYGLNSIKNKK